MTNEEYFKIEDYINSGDCPIYGNTDEYDAEKDIEVELEEDDEEELERFEDDPFAEVDPSDER